MKQLAPKVAVVEVDGEGFNSLLGQRITMYCLDGFIYTGELVGVNDTFIKLQNTSQVFETGPLNDKKWKDAQPFPGDGIVYIPSNAYGPFMILK